MKVMLLNLSTVSHGRNDVADLHTTSVIGIDMPSDDDAIAIEHKGCRDRQEPGRVTVVAWQVDARFGEHSLHLQPDPDRQVERKRIAVRGIGQERKYRLR